MAKTNIKPSPERKAKKTKTEKKPKLAVVKKEKTPKVKKDANYKVLSSVDPMPEVNEGEKSGAYIQRLLSHEQFTAQEIADAVRENFKDSVAKTSDVSFHRTKLKAAGTVYKTVRILKDGERVIAKD